jgi:hypothetical protein
MPASAFFVLPAVFTRASVAVCRHHSKINREIGASSVTFWGANPGSWHLQLKVCRFARYPVNLYEMKPLGLAIMTFTFLGSVAAADEFQDKFKAKLAESLKKMAESMVEGRSFGNTFTIVGPSGDVFSMGDVRQNSDDPKFIVRKYSGGQGKLQWEQSFPSSAQNNW